MSADHRSSSWAADLTPLRQRLAERLRTQGAPHPESAAAALAARGRTAQSRAVFARRLGLHPDELTDIEAGAVPVAAWPPGLARAAREVGVDPTPGGPAGAPVADPAAEVAEGSTEPPWP